MSAAGLHQYGAPTQHMLASRGAEKERLNFYSTTYSINHGKTGFNPRPGRHYGTGYLANFRPATYYSRCVDEHDNPVLGKILEREHGSITTRDYRPVTGPTGKEAMPQSVYMVKSGFVREFPTTTPRTKDVSAVCVDTRERGPVLPKHAPHLEQTRPKDPIQSENKGHGPGFMTTEHSSHYRGDPSERQDTSRKSVGFKLGSGFTHAINVEPVTFRPTEAHLNHSYVGLNAMRPTGVSVMHGDYRTGKSMTGHEAFPLLSARAQYDTGYTTGNQPRPAFTPRTLAEGYTNQNDLHPLTQERIRKRDPAEWANVTAPNNRTTMTQETFRGEQRPRTSQVDQLQRTAVGNKEMTGFSENNDKYTQPPPRDADAFRSHYTKHFWNKTPQHSAREGHTEGGVLPHVTNGFTKSTSLHRKALLPQLDTRALIRSLDAYQAKSVLKRDPLYVDATHDAKLH